MSMFCNQCQEAAKNVGCTVKGVCGKTDAVSNLQDLLIYNLRGIANLINESEKFGINIVENEKNIDNYIIESLFSTITNVNFDEDFFIKKIEEGLKIKKKYKNELVKKAEEQGVYINDELTDDSLWQSSNHEEIYVKSVEIKSRVSKDEDIKSLKELLLYGIKGMAAYYHHANVLSHEDNDIIHYIIKGLAALSNKSISIDELLGLVLECGKFGVQTMALLDNANTEKYGNPEPTEVKLGVGSNSGILISGHDLKDLEELLEQTKGTGVDVYTHGEMLPAHYYPAFKKYDNFVGNYGSAWYNQVEDFDKFNGPILMTTNCLIPPKDKYKERVYTTGTVGFPDVKHIHDREEGKQKDFSQIIEQAKKYDPPTELETGTITGGFAHNAVLSIADKILDAINKKQIKNFVVMAGCDGRHKSREYYTDFAEKLPKDSVILTAGCAKFRYNKLDLGDIGGIPRVLDAGQCNDSYSLAVVALKLAEVLNVNVNDLPIIYNIAWYEQKAVIVLLALLYLGVKKIHLGPTLPAFLSPNVAKVLVEKFEISPISNVEDDISKFFELIS